MTTTGTYYYYQNSAIPVLNPDTSGRKFVLVDGIANQIDDVPIPCRFGPRCDSSQPWIYSYCDTVQNGNQSSHMYHFHLSQGETDFHV